jgi:hypothetical protein
MEQMANIGSEVERTIKWKDKNKEYSQSSFERALELFELTVNDKKNIHRLKEILRAQELFMDFMFDNQYNSTAENWQKYFYAFNYAVRCKT